MRDLIDIIINADLNTAKLIASSMTKQEFSDIIIDLTIKEANTLDIKSYRTYYLLQFVSIDFEYNWQSKEIRVHTLYDNDLLDLHTALIKNGWFCRYKGTVSKSYYKIIWDGRVDN